jgi:hypothetical protein
MSNDGKAQEGLSPSSGRDNSLTLGDSDAEGAFSVHLQYVHPKHPPDKEYRDDGPRDVNDPVGGCFRFPKIEHAAIVAGPAPAYLRDSAHMHSCHDPWPVNLEYCGQRRGIAPPTGLRVCVGTRFLAP